MSDTQSLVLSYQGSLQNELLHTCQLDQMRLSQLSIANEFRDKKHRIDLDELEVRAEIHFTAPKNIINFPILDIVYQKKLADEVHCIIQFMLQGDYEDYQTYVVAIFKLILENSQQQNQYNFLSQLSYDSNVLLYQNKLVWIFADVQHTLEMTCCDLWFCKILGLEFAKTYQFQVVNQVQKVQPPYKMYLNLARKLNVTCPQLKYSNMYEQGQDRYILFKSVYSFQPGQAVEVVCSFTVVFSIAQLLSGFSVQFQDENFNSLILEDPYNILLYVNVSQHLIQKQQNLDVQQQQLDEQTIQQKIEALNVVSTCMQNKNQMTEQELMAKQNQIVQQMYLLFMNNSFNLEVEIQKVTDDKYYEFVKQKKQVVENLLQKFDNLKFDFGSGTDFKSMGTEQMQQFKLMYFQKQAEYLSEKNKILTDCEKPLNLLNQCQEKLHKAIVNQQVEQQRRYDEQRQQDIDAWQQAEARIQYENKNGIAQQRTDMADYAEHQYDKRELEHLQEYETQIHQLSAKQQLKLRNDAKREDQYLDDSLPTYELLLKHEKNKFRKQNYHRILQEEQQNFRNEIATEHEMDDGPFDYVQAAEDAQVAKQQAKAGYEAAKRSKSALKKEVNAKPTYQQQQNNQLNQYYIDKAIIQQVQPKATHGVKRGSASPASREKKDLEKKDLK